MKEQLKNDIYNLAVPLVQAQGLAIWGMELSGNPPRKLVLYVDSLQNENAGENLAPSVSIEQCENISRQLGLALDVEDQMPGPWTLEVSSPGLERKFFNLEQMRSYIGDMLEITLAEPVQCCGQSARHVRGKLLEVREDNFEVEPCQLGSDGEILPMNCEPCQIFWSNCRLVRRMYVFTPPKKPGKGGKKKPG